MAMVHAHLRSWVLVCPSKRRKNPQVVVDAAGAVSQPQHGREASGKRGSRTRSEARITNRCTQLNYNSEERSSISWSCYQQCRVVSLHMGTATGDTEVHGEYFINDQNM